jgi:nucleotide-binding universal stress UspA family protein
MNPILLATDGSPAAFEATREAIRLAQALDERLLIIGVEHVTYPMYGYYGYQDVYDDLHAAEHERNQRVLAEAAHLAEDAGVDCETLAKSGSIDERICELAEQRHVQLIVIGSHGWNALRRFVFGSVSTSVLHRAHCPILVVRAPCQTPEREHVHAEATAV